MGIFTAALVMLAAASCEKNEVLPDNNTNGKVITLKATINTGETKTSLGDKGTNGYPVLWSEGDAIAVINNGKIFKFEYKGTEAVSAVEFTMADDQPAGTTPENFDASAEIKAFYPYDGVTRGGAEYNIPTKQTYAVNSFGNGASPMAAYRAEGSNGALDFQNLFGALKLQIKGMEDENVQSIEIESSNKIAGPAYFDVNQTNQAFSLKIDIAGGDAKNCVTLKCEGEGVSINETTDFIIALHPNANHLKIKIYTNKAVYYRTIDRDNIITAGTILKMAELADMAPAYIDERGIYQGDGIKVSGIIWAPVNCGYEPADGEYKGYPYGKLYQWGRKYGQGYNSTYDATTPEIYTAEPVTLDVGQSESNMNVLFRNFKDWLSSPDDELWNSGTEKSPEKTVYDPCPNGWRVPTKGELSNLCQNRSSWTTNAAGQQGFWFSGATSYTQEVPQVFFPAAGYHHYLADPAQGRGYNGNYWSSIAYQGDNSAWNLSIHPGSDMDVESAEINNSCFRANGYSVRCVKE